MLNNPQSHGLWEMTAAPAPATASLTGGIDADVVIVGGGYTGLSAALHLAEGGAKVALLEAVEIGFGGAGRNVGLVNAGMWVMPKALIDTLGEDYGNRLLDALGNGPRQVFALIERLGIACEAEPHGTLHCAVGTEGLKELEDRAAQWQARGAPVELLGADETRRKVGGGTYAGSLLDKRAGTIQPLAYARGLAHAAVKAGAQIFTASPVLAIEETGNRWEVRTATGWVKANWVIVATDAYSHGPWAALREEQVYLPYFNFATRPLSPAMQKQILPERQGAWDTKEVLTSFRFDRAGRLVFGSVGALAGAGEAIHRAWAIRSLRRLFPDIGPVAFDAAWYGMIGMTSDNLPRLHTLGRNIIAFSGYNGRGISPGTVFGERLAAHILGKVSQADLPLPVSAFETRPFRRLRERYYQHGAELVHLTEARF